jgi:hypothetical protein
LSGCDDRGAILSSIISLRRYPDAPVDGRSVCMRRGSERD